MVSFEVDSNADCEIAETRARAVCKSGAWRKRVRERQAHISDGRHRIGDRDTLEELTRLEQFLRDHRDTNTQLQSGAWRKRV